MGTDWLALAAPSTTIPLGPLTGWFVLLAVKHVLADFYLQPEWMAVGKDGDTQWLRPLVAHCLVHGALTTLLLLGLHVSLWFLGPVDFAVHIVIDWLKGAATRRYRLSPAVRPFWGVLGIDQMLHHLTGFALAVIIASH